jgi:uncharacterized protein (DUF2062 family)
MTTSPADPRPDTLGGYGGPEPQPRGLRAKVGRTWRKFWALLTGGAQNPLRTSAALGLGIAVALIVPPPFQTPAVLGLAVICRLNSLVAFAGTLIYQPFTMPFIVYFECRVGAWLLPPSPGSPQVGFWTEWAQKYLTKYLGGTWIQWAGRYIEQYLVGAPVTALAGGALGALFCYLFLLAWRGTRRMPNGGGRGTP